MKLIEGLNLSLAIKKSETNESTSSDYTRFIKRFVDYLHLQKMEDMDVMAFKKKDAIHYLDYVLRERKIAALTRNNYMLTMRALFYVLKDREYIEENPFANIKKLKVAKKRRKMYCPIERTMLTNYFREVDSGLFLGVSLCYYCALRRSELRHLKIGDIDLDRGLVTLDGTETKNKEVARITMSKFLVSYLKEIRIKKYPLHYYVFGSDLQPSTTQCGVNAFTRKHRYFMRKLKACSILDDIEGKTFYSWKDTAAADMIKAGFNIITIMKHFRHNDIGTTQRYLESFADYTNDIENFEINLF